MKELTIEEKAKRYDKAFKEAENIHKFSSDPAEIKRMEQIFPELKESEDERIRKEIIKYFKKYPALSLGDYNVQDILAWLEKQGEHANFFNKIQIGDKVTRNRDGVLVNLSQLNRVAKPAEKQDEQNPAWSEEDESRMDNMCHFLKEYGDQYYGGLTLKGTISWLKSLRPQSTWKPSDEQMKVLLSEVNAWTKGCPKQKVLESLYNDLKKLMEE